MKRHGVRPSVCPSTGPQQQTRCRRFAAVDTSIDCCSGGGGGRTRAVPRYQRTQVAEHRLVNSKSCSIKDAPTLQWQLLKLLPLLRRS